MHSVHNVIMLNKSFNQQTNHRAYVKIKYIILYMNTGVSFMGAGAALAPPLIIFFIIWGSKIGVKRALFDFFFIVGWGANWESLSPAPPIFSWKLRPWNDVKCANLVCDERKLGKCCNLFIIPALWYQLLLIL